MDDNLTLILKKFQDHKGQFVINHGTVERLIAIATDDEDYYYVFWNGRKINWSSCVGAFVPLKGKIDDRHYNDFINTAKLNHYDVLGEISEKFEWLGNTEEVKKKMTALTLPDRFLTEVCWDLN